MAKFTVIAKDVFTDLVRAFGKKGAEFGGDLENQVARGLRRHNKTRESVRQSYTNKTGKPIPEGKVVLRTDFLKNLREAVRIKKGDQVRSELLIPRARREELGLPSGAAIRGQRNLPKGDRDPGNFKRWHKMKAEMREIRRREEG